MILSKQEYVSSSSLIRLCIRIYLRSRERCYVNYLKGGAALFKTWYTNCSNIDDLASISDSFPIICYCGRRWSDTGSNIIYSCNSCNASYWPLDYELNQLCTITGIPYLKLKHLFALELEYGYQTQTTQLFLSFTSA